MRLAVAIAAAFVLAAAPAWAAGGAALTLRPTSVSRGSTVTFTGAGCLRGDSVFLISKLFPGHAFGGAGSIKTTARSGGHFRRAFVVRGTTAPGRYVITGRCGGGNLGVEAHLRVR
jgi:hypothetical protein